MTRAIATIDTIVPDDHAANDETAAGVPATSETRALELATREALTPELATWIDAVAVALAAGLRVNAQPSPGFAPGEPEVMNADEVAMFLHVDRKTVSEYALRGVIPHRRLGKRLLFSRTALVAWLGATNAPSQG